MEHPEASKAMNATVKGCHQVIRAWHDQVDEIISRRLPFGRPKAPVTAHPPSPHIPKTMQTGLMQWQNVSLVVGVVGVSMA